MLALLPAPRAAALTGGPVTIDLDTTDVEVYGRKKRGVAYNYQGQRVGRPHVATWAEAEIVLAADLGDGTDDPRATAPDLLRRALAACRSGPGLRAGWRCAPTPGTSPARWPAPRTRRTSASRSAPSGSRRCGGCWPGSLRTTGTTRSTWTAPRSRSLSTARTGGRRTRRCWSAGSCWTRPRSPPTRGPGGAAPCTQTSGPCRSPSWPAPGRSTPTRSS